MDAQNTASQTSQPPQVPAPTAMPVKSASIHANISSSSSASLKAATTATSRTATTTAMATTITPAGTLGNSHAPFNYPTSTTAPVSTSPQVRHSYADLTAQHHQQPQHMPPQVPPIPPPHRSSVNMTTSTSTTSNASSVAPGFGRTTGKRMTPPPPPIPQAPTQSQTQHQAQASSTLPIPIPIPASHHAQQPRSHPPVPVTGVTFEKLPPGTVLTVGKHTVTIVKYLSEGGFAHIYVVKTNPCEQGSDIACLKRVIVPNKEGLNQLRAEVEVMQRLSNSENIVRYYDSNASRIPDAIPGAGVGTGSGQGTSAGAGVGLNTSSGRYEVLVLMELCPNKSLLDFMNTRLRTKLTVEEILKIMLDIGKAVYNMHRMKLIHRDIKIENVLLDGNFNFKLADFGSTCPVLRVPRNHQEFQILHNDILTQTTPQYRAPEMIDLYRGLPVDEKSDIWALGVFLYKLCYYTTPFEIAGELAILHAAYTFPAQPQFPSGIKNLINIMLQENPMFRPNIYQVLVEVNKLMIQGQGQGQGQGQSTGSFLQGYEDFYGLGSYAYPVLDHVHPAIEPFTPSVMPMFSPFKAPPKDPLEKHREMEMRKLMQQQQQQQQQQTQQKMTMPVSVPAPSEARTKSNLASTPTPPLQGAVISTSTATSTHTATSINNHVNAHAQTLDVESGFDDAASEISMNSQNISTIEEADPFSHINLKHSNTSGTTGTMGTTKSIPHIVLTKSDRERQRKHDGAEEGDGDVVSVNVDVDANSDVNVNADDDDVEIRFPPIADMPQRSKSMRVSKKRYSSHNPFPMVDGKSERDLDAGVTGGSIISFEDIKQDLIDIEGSHASVTMIPGSGTSTSAFAGQSKSSLSLHGGHRRLSSEQLQQEEVNFSD